MTKQHKPVKFYEMKKKETDSKKAEVFIYGAITKMPWDELDEVSASSFKKELDDLGDLEVIDLYINSPGGDVFEGVTILNMLKRHKATVNVHIDALAASIASVIAMAGDTITMPANSMMMIHNAWGIFAGNSKELRKAADDLERINNSVVQSYKDHGVNLSDEDLTQMLDDETWLTATEAVEYGFADVLEESNQAVACLSERDMKYFNKVPDELKADHSAPAELTEEEKGERQRMAEEARSSSTYIDTILGGI